MKSATSPAMVKGRCKIINVESNCNMKTKSRACHTVTSQYRFHDEPLHCWFTTSATAMWKQVTLQQWVDNLRIQGKSRNADMLTTCTFNRNAKGAACGCKCHWITKSTFLHIVKLKSRSLHEHMHIRLLWPCTIRDCKGNAPKGSDFAVQQECNNVMSPMEYPMQFSHAILPSTHGALNTQQHQCNHYTRTEVTV